MSGVPRWRSRAGFTPISIAKYIPLHMKSNPGESRAALEAALRENFEAAQNGECCDCGEPIWVIGSAIAGRACFTCVTGEDGPSDDYEITHIQ
jgi:hypothetical protein